MPSTGIDRYTGKVLTGLAHTRQSVEVIFTTPIGARIMRRTFGSAVPALLGRENLTEAALARFFFAIVVAIDLWEPRLRVAKVNYPAPQNTKARFRLGQMGMQVLASYRPNALQGDFTSDVVIVDL